MLNSDWITNFYNVYIRIYLFYFFISILQLESGLRAQDLQEAKDQLLVETSDMFHVPLFTAEVLLRNHGMWNIILPFL